MTPDARQNDRTNLMSLLDDYDSMRRDHVWRVPRQYNIASDVCDKHSPSKVAMLYEGPGLSVREVRWSELQELTGRWANFLISSGVSKGDRVAAVLPASPETAAIIMATLKVGAIMVTMSTLWSDDSLEYRIADCSPTMVLTNSRGLERNPLGRCEVSVDVADVRLDRYSPKCPTVPTSADDAALIYYTSGSTGNPKGVVSPHRAFLAHNEFEYCQDLREGELSYWMGDWAWGVYKLLGPWRLGAVNAVQQTKERYDPERLLSFLSKSEVTNVFFNPTGLRGMAQVDRANERFPQKFRVCCSANEPLQSNEAEWFRDQFGIEVLENYGMTEAYPMVGNFLTLSVKPGSIGRPVPGWDVHVLDEDGQQVGAGGDGEICLRARSNPQYPLGYWNLPEQSQLDFGGDWFHTKDRAHIDEDGYFWHKGRADDLIKSAGYRLSPEEIENVCKALPEVANAAVIGVPDAKRGQLVKAFLVLEDGVTPSSEVADRVKRYVRDHHSSFGYPKIIEFIDELPTSQSGKITRSPLRTRAPQTEF